MQSQNECRMAPASDPLLAAVEACWSEARGPRRRLPLRRDIDPGRLGEAMGRTLILERVAGSGARIRVTGQELCAWARYDLRGATLAHLFPEAERFELAGLLEPMFRDPARLGLPLRSGDGGAAQLTLLPMLGSDGLSSMALGVLTGSAGTAPLSLRFDTARPAVLTPIGLRQARLGSDRQAIAPPPRTDHPVLRLVVDNG